MSIGGRPNIQHTLYKRHRSDGKHQLRTARYYHQTDSLNAYGIETRTDKNKVMGKAEIDINGVLLQTLSSFKYVRAAFFKAGSSTADIHILIATGAATTLGLLPTADLTNP